MTGNKRAYLVLGAESSGTRFATQLLIEAGAKGQSGHSQSWDNTTPVSQEKIVWRRSVPHAQKWSFIEDMISELRIRDYEVIALITTRDWYAIMNSQIGKHVKDQKTAFRNTAIAYEVIFSAIGSMDIPYIMFSYEAAVNRGVPYINEILEMLGLNALKEAQIRNANDKYYKKGR